MRYSLEKIWERRFDWGTGADEFHCGKGFDIILDYDNLKEILHLKTVRYFNRNSAFQFSYNIFAL